MAVLDGLGEAFTQVKARPAVFDRQLRKQLGVWELAEPIPIDEIVTRFRSLDGFIAASNELIIPLHEADTAELTGRYLIYRPDDECMVFYDFSENRFVQIELSSFSRTYPAWRIRYWHPGYEPDTPPSYLDKPTEVYDDVFDADQSLEATTGPLDTDLFEDLRAFVEREREAERENARGVFANLRASRYHEEYNGIAHAEPIGRDVDAYGQQIVQLEVTDKGLPDDTDAAGLSEVTGLYPGVEVIIGRVDGDGGFPVEGEILDIEGRRLDLGVYWDRATDKGKAEAAFGSESDARFRIGILLNPVPFDRQTTAIDTVAENEEKRAILTGEKSLSFDPEASITIRTDFLNAHQKQAVRTALRANDVFCIHGPPGTGKTRTLTEIIKKAVADGDRVLACAHSNQAVDNLLVGRSTTERVDPTSLHAAAENDDLLLARAGEHSENPVVETEYATTEAWKADVVGATTSGADQFQVNEFDLAVLDEASQATIPSSLIPLTKSNRLILGGDHRQLPPYHSSEQSAEEEMGESLFEHLITLYDDGISLMLERQYRMNQEIAAFPNKEFYDGRLTHGQENRTWTLGTLPAIKGVQVSGEESRTPGHSYYNELEAKAVARHVSQLLFNGVRAYQIGVITPYSGQVGKIHARLQELDEIDPRIREIEIATVDAFQGSERDAIIASFVRSNPEGFTGFLTFPTEGPRRLNVALTRAKKRLVLIGNWDTLTTVAPDRSAEDSCAGLYANLYDHLVTQNRFDKFQ